MKRRSRLMIVAVIISMLVACDKPVDNKAPTVSFTSPANNSSFMQGETITFSVEVDDPEEDMKEVRFYVDNIGLISDQSWPYSYELETGSYDVGEYDIKAEAIDSDGGKGESQIAITIYILEAPTDLSATSISDSEIQLTWTDNTDYETGFKIERDDGDGFVEIGTVASDITEYADIGLTFGQNYIYQVAAYTSAYTSSWTTITAATEFPAPTNLSAISISDSEVQLNWTDNTGYEIGFKIERDNGGEFTVVGTVSADVIEFTDSDLAFGQSYFYRVAAYTSVNNSDYSATVTVCASCVTDIDGNTYETVQIGDQVWMAENLKVTHYRDGTALTTNVIGAAWGELTTEAYCIYNNNASNEVDTYGALYNWHAVVDSRNIAPVGWHIPTDDEWKELEIAIGMSQSEADAEGWRGVNEGRKLAGNAALWGLENDSDFGSSGFNALPGGACHYSTGGYSSMGSFTAFWSATEVSGVSAWSRRLINSSSGIDRNNFMKGFGCSIRCLRD